jgi:hypothetical protein
MNEKLDRTPDARQRTESEDAIRRSPIDATDVEGHSIRREGDGAIRRDDLGEGVAKRSFADDGSDDVEGHSIRREGDGAIRRADLGDGVAKRSYADDGSDDVEGHSIRREGDGAIRRDDEGFTREVGPGEGHISRQ